MTVGVAIFELHIEHAQSLKEKRMVMKSLRDRIRNRFQISAAEVGMQELHQRGRIGISLVAIDQAAALQMLDSVSDFVAETADATLAGWTQELLDFDSEVNLGIRGLDWTDK